MQRKEGPVRAFRSNLETSTIQAGQRLPVALTAARQAASNSIEKRGLDLLSFALALPIMAGSGAGSGIGTTTCFARAAFLAALPIVAMKSLTDAGRLLRSASSPRRMARSTVKLRFGALASGGSNSFFILRVTTDAIVPLPNGYSPVSMTY